MDDHKFWNCVAYIAECSTSEETPGVARADDIDSLIYVARFTLHNRVEAIAKATGGVS